MVKEKKMKHYKLRTPYITICSLLHPLFVRIVPIIRTYKLVPFRCQEIPKGQVIFAANHSNVHDAPTVWEIVKKHVFVLGGDEPRGDFNGIALAINGVIWVKRAHKESKRDAKNNMLKLLEKEQMLDRGIADMEDGHELPLDEAFQKISELRGNTPIRTK